MNFAGNYLFSIRPPLAVCVRTDLPLSCRRGGFVHYVRMYLVLFDNPLKGHDLTCPRCVSATPFDWPVLPLVCTIQKTSRMSSSSVEW